MKKEIAKRKFKTWKTIKLGTYKSGEELLQALRVGGFSVGYHAEELLKQTALSNIKTEIELIMLTVAQLGFDQGTRRDAIYSRAKELGLDLVSLEVGPELRLQYTNQPRGEWLMMAMEPIAHVVGPPAPPGMFNVGRSDDRRWIDTFATIPEFLWDPESVWVFARPKEN